MSDKEWTLNSGFPESMKSFGSWESRKNQTDIANKPIYRKEEPQKSIAIDVGQIFLDELKKHHRIENGFQIVKLQDIIINIDGSNFQCQLFSVKTPWKELPSFTFYSPKDNEGFTKFASKIRGQLVIGKQGSIDNPQPYWTWNTLTIDGLEQVEKNGPPICVDYHSNTYYGYLASFFTKENNPLLR